MTGLGTPTPEALAREVRLYVFRQAADTARVPQPPQIAEALRRSQAARISGDAPPGEGTQPG